MSYGRPLANGDHRVGTGLRRVNNFLPGAGRHHDCRAFDTGGLQRRLGGGEMELGHVLVGDDRDLGAGTQRLDARLRGRDLVRLDDGTLARSVSAIALLGQRWQAALGDDAALLQGIAAMDGPIPLVQTALPERSPVFEGSMQLRQPLPSPCSGSWPTAV